MNGIITGTANQTFRPFQLAQEDLRASEVHLSMLRFSMAGAVPRRPNRLAAALRQEARIISEMKSGKISFMFINAAASFLRREIVYRQINLADRLGITTFIHWRNCPWIFSGIRQRIGNPQFRNWLQFLKYRRLIHLAVSHTNRAQIESSLGVTFSGVLPNCVPIDGNAASYLPDTEPPVVLGLGSIQLRKGNDVFVQIASDVCSKHSDVQFVWVGGVPDSALLNMVRATGLSSRVCFKQWSAEPTNWLIRCSALLAPSRSEAFGLIGAEAMSHYRTVFALESTGLEEVLGGTGITAHPLNLQPLSDGIMNLLESAPKDRVNPAAFDRCKREYSPPVFAERLSKILDDNCR